MSDVAQRRQEGRVLVERLSKILDKGIPNVDLDLRFTYVDDSFRVWWGERGDPDTSALITFEQLRTLNDDETRQIIRSAVIRSQ